MSDELSIMDRLAGRASRDPFPLAPGYWRNVTTLEHRHKHQVLFVKYIKPGEVFCLFTEDALFPLPFSVVRETGNVEMYYVENRNGEKEFISPFDSRVLSTEDRP